MMLFSDNSHAEQRAREFAHKQAGARELRKGVEAMDAITAGSDKGFTEPTPSDVMMLHDPVVSPDLRASIIEARKRMWMMSDEDRIAYREALDPLADAIQNMIDTYGFKFTPLMRLLSPSSMPSKGNLSARVVQNHQMGAKLAKFVGGEDFAKRANDLNWLVSPLIPTGLRRRLIAAKNALGAAQPHQRQALRKQTSALFGEIDGLAGVIGADGVAALHRLLA